MRVRAVISGVASAALLVLSAALPATAAPSPSAPGTHVALPPQAPAPTDSGNSPMVPDPHPPLGGLAPDGTVAGGPRLRSRGVIKPAGTKPLPGSLTAQSWILVDLDNGDILAARDPHGRYQPASILKLLTAVTVLPLLPGRQSVTVTTSAALAEGSRAGLISHGRYTIDQLFAALLLVSGNDAADALADAAGGYQHTVELMNQTALKLGAYDTYAQTPSGLDGWQQLTSAYDMALVLRAAMDMPRFLAYDREQTATLPWQQVNGYGPVTLQNQCLEFLTTVRGALAAKSGYTDAAQHTFVAAMKRDGRRLGVVFLRGQRWPTDHWQQATDLMNWGFSLPAGTAPVGQLMAPNVAAAVAAPLLPVSAASAHAAASSAGHRGHGTAYIVLAGFALVAAASVSWRLRPGAAHGRGAAR